MQYFTRNLVDPTKQAFKKREFAVKSYSGSFPTEVLCVNFAGTMQEKDIKVRTDLPQDKATGTFPYRFKINNKSIDPEERKRNGKEPFDFSDEKAIIKALGETYSFDMPLWYLREAKDDLRSITNYDRPLIFQTRGCNLHDWTDEGGCTYCYVDAQSNSINSTKRQQVAVPNNLNRIETDGGVWLTAKNIVDTAEDLMDDGSMRNGTALHSIRHSGGETTTELDFTLEIQKEIESRRIDHELFAQFDTNLSTYRFINQMIREKNYQPDILTQLADHNTFVYAAFKGTNDANIQRNTQAKLTVDDQMDAFGLLVDSGLRIYPCIYNPDWKSMGQFLDRLDDNFVNASKMLRVEKIKWEYGPTVERVKRIAEANKIDAKELGSGLAKEEEENYEISQDIMKGFLKHRYNLPYKEFDRTQFKISAKQ